MIITFALNRLRGKVAILRSFPLEELDKMITKYRQSDLVLLKYSIIFALDQNLTIL